MVEYFYEDLYNCSEFDDVIKFAQEFRDTWGEDMLCEAFLCFRKIACQQTELKKPTEIVPLIQVFKTKANVERLLKAPSEIFQKAAALALEQWPPTETG